MSGADPTPEDMAALGREGDRGAFFRDLIARGVARKTPAVVPPTPRQPGRRAGTWPPGTSPPGPAVQAEDADWPAALAEYCAWSAAGCPPGQYRCECPAHQTPGGTT